MQWPLDHPAVTDEALKPWAHHAAAVAPGAQVVRLLRHLPGRRVATHVKTADGQSAVLKIFASPRARGNDRRLEALQRSWVRDLVPRPLGVDATGHVSLVEWVDGVMFDQSPDDCFAAAAFEVGVSLRQLHESNVELDRSWTIRKELALLDKRRTPTVEQLITSMGGMEQLADLLADEPLVTAHRDCHPRQAVMANGSARWIDLDDCAMAPAGLDVGNMIAHLKREAAVGLRDQTVADTAVAAFRRGYGLLPATTDIWERLSLVRLCGLAETRHQRSDWLTSISSLIQDEAATAAASLRLAS
jgi:Ser/Thr protein kinase RdoA (MazF antagonist)